MTRGAFDIPTFPTRERTPLELSLLTWACVHWPEEPGRQHVVDAIWERYGDWEFERKCVGAIFRRVARQSPRWLVEVAAAVPDQVLQLAPWITPLDERTRTTKQLEMPWGFVPGRLSWREWVEAAGVTFDARGAAAPPPPAFVPDPTAMTVNVTPATVRRANGKRSDRDGFWTEGAGDGKR